jgi:hypothetical protein
MKETAARIGCRFRFLHTFETFPLKTENTLFQQTLKASQIAVSTGV